MYQSILHFIENDIKSIEKLFGQVITGEKDTDDLSADIRDRTTNLASRMIGELYELLDNEIRESLIRKKKWNIEHRNEEKELLDVTGMIRFKRTGYLNKHSGEYVYLLDRILGFEKNQRITLGAAAAVLEETILTSYSKGGKNASPTDGISKQAVKELVHGTVIEFPLPEVKEKKKIKYLHIVADEDHVAAQFWNKKGDLQKDSRGNTINTIMPKLIVLFEDMAAESEASKEPRIKLTGKRVFSGVANGNRENEALWKQVWDYIEHVYDTDYLEKVYIAGDGAAWIKAGCDVLYKSCFVLDKFHIMKYVNNSTAHLLDSADDVKSDIWECINGAHRKRLKEVYEKILSVTDPESGKYEDVIRARDYLLNNWKGIKIRRNDAGGRWPCCAEGQVSHILSARMSSRPMGWSELGCDQMSQFRAYRQNGGKIIDLLKYQKKKQLKEAHRKEQEDLINELKKKQSGWDYADQIKGAIPGLEQHSLKWLKEMVRTALDA